MVAQNLGLLVKPRTVNTISVVTWKKPKVGWFKLDTDGCSKGNPGLSSFGVIIRDHSAADHIANQAFISLVDDGLNAPLDLYTDRICYNHEIDKELRGICNLDRSDLPYIQLSSKPGWNILWNTFGYDSVLVYFSLEVFKKVMWSMGAGVSKGMSRSSIAYVFVMSIYLTNSGLEKFVEVIEFVYQYIKLLCQLPPPEWTFKGLQDIGNINFRFVEEQPHGDYAINLAGPWTPSEKDLLLLAQIEEVLLQIQAKPNSMASQHLAGLMISFNNMKNWPATEQKLASSIPKNLTNDHIWPTSNGQQLNASCIRELELICQLKEADFHKIGHYQGKGTYWQKALPAVNTAMIELFKAFISMQHVAQLINDNPP
ncbi:hypothetical protein ZIOFF_020900 [Zingiber officinale]|uniref:Uncharacterized protein n=1 Tax=Zingiber officinale TaxID=94328 RepID=A0A8J5H322_ZINOF|nr:hypothetical protein ZIOFF_020900 [Zingiber officinale]